MYMDLDTSVPPCTRFSYKCCVMYMDLHTSVPKKRESMYMAEHLCLNPCTWRTLVSTREHSWTLVHVHGWTLVTENVSTMTRSSAGPETLCIGFVSRFHEDWDLVMIMTEQYFRTHGSVTTILERPCFRGFWAFRFWVHRFWWMSGWRTRHCCALFALPVGRAARYKGHTCRT